MLNATRCLLTTLTLAALVVAVAPAAASSSIFGPTGLLRVPTADTLEPPGLDFSVYWSDVATSLSMNVGVLPEVEVSAIWIDPRGDRNTTLISGKWRLWEETETRPALAAGVYDITNEHNFTLFGALQKHFIVGDTPVKVVAGLGTANSLVEGLFAGAEIMLGRGFSALVEFDGSNTNAALRYPLTDDLQLTAGAVRDQLTVGARYSIR